MSMFRERPCRQRGRTGVRCAAIGDAEAFYEFYVANAGGSGVLARRTPEREVARDLTAETLATALQCRDQFRGHTHAEAEAWLFAIARRARGCTGAGATAERRALAHVGLGLAVTTAQAELDASRSSPGCASCAATCAGR